MSARNPWESGLPPPKHSTAGLGLVVAFFVLGLLPGLAGAGAAERLPQWQGQVWGVTLSVGFPLSGFLWALLCGGSEEGSVFANQLWCCAGCGSCPGLRSLGSQGWPEVHPRSAGSRAQERSELQNSIAVMLERLEGWWCSPFQGPQGPSSCLDCSIPEPRCTAQCYPCKPDVSCFQQLVRAGDGCGDRVLLLLWLSDLR